MTLLELLIVITIIGLVASLVTLAVRPSPSRMAQQEGSRLAALLDTARQHSKRLGVPVVWRPTMGGFEFIGLPAGTLPNHWLSTPPPHVIQPATLTLGPEPVIPQNTIVLEFSAPDAPQPLRIQVRTDGLSDFEVR